MKDFFEFNQDDKTLWLGILVISAIIVVLLSVFTTTSMFYYIERFLITIAEMFVPGYLIMKLFFDKLQLTEYKVIDKFLVSLFFSIATVQTLYFLFTYLRTYVFNVDEDVISSNKLAVFIALFVTGAAFGIKYYLNKTGGAGTSAEA